MPPRITPYHQESILKTSHIIELFHYKLQTFISSNYTFYLSSSRYLLYSILFTKRYSRFVPPSHKKSPATSFRKDVAGDPSIIHY